MGGSSYSFDERDARAETRYSDDRSTADIFEQSRHGRIHESMDPKGVTLREARDSDVHPRTVPVILGLDMTGSMMGAPDYLVRKGLPKLMGELIERGVPGAAVCFVGVGDHKFDRYPLQFGQFESGDEELDMWLERVYLEGGGGGNGGESYSLVWDFANRVVQTDAWDKRQEKGILITIGDEPLHNTLSGRVIEVLYGLDETPAEQYVDALLEEVTKKWEVFHIHVTHGSSRNPGNWSDLLGERLVVEPDVKQIPDVVATTVLKLRGEDATDAYGAVEPARAGEGEGDSTPVRPPEEVELL